MDWQVGENVVIWSIKSQQMYNGIVESIDTMLKILVHSSGKVYNYNLDGSAIDLNGRTNQRVFSTRQLNEVIVDEQLQAASGG